MRLQQHACCRCCCSLTSCVNDQNDQCKATLVPRATVGISNWIPILGGVTAVTFQFRILCPGVYGHEPRVQHLRVD